MNTPPPLPAGRSPRQVRACGWLLIFLGLLLSGGMSYLAWVMVGIVNAPAEPGGFTRWHGSPEMTRRMFWLFGCVGVFGLVTLFNGVWCARHGVFQPVLRALFVAVAVAMVAAGALVMSTPK